MEVHALFQVAPKKKTALVPKTNALPKISDDLKARAGSLSEAAHDRTASFGSAASEGTDGSHQDSASQGSVKSTASSLGKRECYENVVPPFTIEVSIYYMYIWDINVSTNRRYVTTD